MLAFNRATFEMQSERERIMALSRQKVAERMLNRVRIHRPS
jgi:hypothetical protein